MQRDDTMLSAQGILSLSAEVLSKGGYRISTAGGLVDLKRGRSIVAEDDFAVVAIVVFDSWAELRDSWPEAQGELVNLISQRLAKSAPKMWDAYLVVFCRGIPDDKSAISLIERDTTRVRKLVATAEMVRLTGDIERVLEPFLPLEIPETSADLQDVLTALPRLLEKDIDPRYTQAIVDAFRDLDGPMEKLQDMLRLS